MCLVIDAAFGCLTNLLLPMQELQADLVLWTAGSSPVSKEGVSEKTPKLPFPATERGAVRTDPTLRVKDHPRVFALGDVAGSEAPDASTSGNSLPATAQVLSMLPIMQSHWCASRLQLALGCCLVSKHAWLLHIHRALS